MEINYKRAALIEKIKCLNARIKAIGDFIDYEKLVTYVMEDGNISERTAKDYIKAAGILSPREIKKLSEDALNAKSGAQETL